MEIIIVIIIIVVIAMVLRSQGVRNYQSAIFILEWLRRGLRNCQRIGQALGVKPLNRQLVVVVVV